MKITVSTGEALDKASILKIKLIQIKDQTKHARIQKEFNSLRNSVKEYLKRDVEDLICFHDLVNVNTILWRLENDIREKENLKQFDKEFVEIARQIYIQNDCRFRLKQFINQVFESEIQEEKSYQ